MRARGFGPALSFAASVAAAVQPGSADGASQVERTNSWKPNLSKAVKHHWYGDTSPWTEQRLEDNYGFKGPQSRPTAKVVILDQENPDPLEWLRAKTNSCR
jgi:hypothetical protein